MRPTIKKDIRKIVKTVFETLSNTDQKELTIVLADNDFVQTLNRTYRQKDQPTNVLSFPFEEPDLLGDVVLAFETVYEEAKDQGKSFLHHVSHLVAHGVLHLLGYDHQSDETFDRMKHMEIKILGQLHLPDPYQPIK